MTTTSLCWPLCLVLGRRKEDKREPKSLSFQVLMKKREPGQPSFLKLLNHPVTWLTKLQSFTRMHQGLLGIHGPGHKNASTERKSLHAAWFILCLSKACGRTAYFFMRALHLPYLLAKFSIFCSLVQLSLGRSWFSPSWKFPQMITYHPLK